MELNTSDSIVGSQDGGSDVTFRPAAPGPATDSSPATSGTSSLVTVASDESMILHRARVHETPMRAMFPLLETESIGTPLRAMDSRANPEGTLAREITDRIFAAAAAATPRPVPLPPLSEFPITSAVAVVEITAVGFAGGDLDVEHRGGCQTS